MARNSKPRESDEAPGAPDWMVTFSDCMTLLLTFFVLLLSFSSFDEIDIMNLTKISMRSLPTVSEPVKENEDAVIAPMTPILSTGKYNKGSENPTFTKGRENNLRESQEYERFRHRKVFLNTSDKFFWGQGITISKNGITTLEKVADLLKRMPGRVVISENSPVNENDNQQLGLQRAWAIMDNLTRKHGLDKNRFNLSSASTLVQKHKSNEVARAGNNRMVEIIILERSIYN